MTDMNKEIAEGKGFGTLKGNVMLNESLLDDCQGLEFTFDRVKLPTGGGTTFEIPCAGNDGYEMAKDITGVIIYNHPAYAFYRDKYTGGNNPPDCKSFDGIRGVGVPGGLCAECPFNRYGSGEGQSKLCKNKRTLYILRKNEMFPIILSLPTGSLKSFTNYVKIQLFSGRKLNQVVTKITLKKAVNTTGIIFSQAVFSCESILSPEEYEAAAKMSETIKGYVTTLTPASSNNYPSYVDPETGEVIDIWDSE